MLRVLRPHAVRVVDSGLRMCAQSTMAERAATRRRFYYNILEVQALQALAASIIHIVTAYIIHVVGLLISAPALLHFGAVLFGLAFGQLRLATAALALALRRASQREADYPHLSGPLALGALRVQVVCRHVVAGLRGEAHLKLHGQATRVSGSPARGRSEAPTRRAHAGAVQRATKRC